MHGPKNAPGDRVSYSISIVDNATPTMMRLAAALNAGESMNRAIAEAALPVFQNHFRGLAGSNKNRFGARGGYWNRMLSGTKAVGTNQAAIIRMPREMALRYFGGTVTPKGGAKNLSIPARTEAYGKSARDFNDLRFVQFGRGGAKALVQRDQTSFTRTKSGKRKGQISGQREIGGMVFYWLVPKATIRGDRSVLPDEQEIIKGARRGLESYLAFVARRK